MGEVGGGGWATLGTGSCGPGPGFSATRGTLASHLNLSRSQLLIFKVELHDFKEFSRLLPFMIYLEHQEGKGEFSREPKPTFLCLKNLFLSDWMDILFNALCTSLLSETESTKFNFCWVTQGCCHELWCNSQVPLGNIEVWRTVCLRTKWRSTLSFTQKWVWGSDLCVCVCVCVCLLLF